MSEPEWNQERGLAPHAERETQQASALENNEGCRLGGGRKAKVAQPRYTLMPAASDEEDRRAGKCVTPPRSTGGGERGAGHRQSRRPAPDGTREHCDKHLRPTGDDAEELGGR